jgi:uncharacterized coiled-coil protein SlyX
MAVIIFIGRRSFQRLHERCVRSGAPVHEIDARIAEQDARIAEQDARIAEQDARVAELEKKLAALIEERGRNSSNSNLPPSSDPN